MGFDITLADMYNVIFGAGGTSESYGGFIDTLVGAYTTVVVEGHSHSTAYEVIYSDVVGNAEIFEVSGVNIS